MAVGSMRVWPAYDKCACKPYTFPSDRAVSPDGSTIIPVGSARPNGSIGSSCHSEEATCFSCVYREEIVNDMKQKMRYIPPYCPVAVGSTVQHGHDTTKKLDAVAMLFAGSCPPVMAMPAARPRIGGKGGWPTAASCIASMQRCGQC